MSYIAPWDVAAAKKLGIYNQLMAAREHHVTRIINYDELLTHAQAETGTLPLSHVHPKAAGPRCMQHVSMQNTLLQHAKACGVKITRGVSDVAVRAGAMPSVTYAHGRTSHARRCRIVIGADGRSSTVRRQLGLTLHENEVDHLISGLLIEGAHDGRNHVLHFPAGQTPN
ncbi:MAG: FAD-dependent monooxygenase [Gammaproteobacteria bacterium]|nr:FAD-dependent monooxygenase [Gammaproteobacteria bacterium]